MTSFTEADRKRCEEKISARLCPQNPCVACKAALTPSEVAEIRAIADELKRISGCMFGAKNTGNEAR